ncbi:MAG: hypothetical protein K2X38_09585 [Gemmataceae bacterium]|nr:hypothetical protein [Gemmataceae bacterium]
MNYRLRDEAVKIEERLESLAAKTVEKLGEPLAWAERKASEEALVLLRRAIVHWERFCGEAKRKCLGSMAGQLRRAKGKS